jgi:hypothetical protein
MNVGKQITLPLMPRARVKLVEAEDPKCTEWVNVHTTPPWCSGFWKINAGTFAPTQVRAWFNKPANTWSYPGKINIPTDRLQAAAQWCGLVDKPTTGYAYFVPGSLSVGEAPASRNKKNALPADVHEFSMYVPTPSFNLKVAPETISRAKNLKTALGEISDKFILNSQINKGLPDLQKLAGIAPTRRRVLLND